MSTYKCEVNPKDELLVSLQYDGELFIEVYHHAKEESFDVLLSVDSAEKLANEILDWVSKQRGEK